MITNSGITIVITVTDSEGVTINLCKRNARGSVFLQSYLRFQFQCPKCNDKGGLCVLDRTQELFNITVRDDFFKPTICSCTPLLPRCNPDKVLTANKIYEIEFSK